MLSYLFKKVKPWSGNAKGDLYVAVIIFMVGMAGFGLGRLSVLWIPKESITLTPEPDNTNKQEASYKNIIIATSTASGKYMGSKSGNSYYLPTCPGASRIKEENKIWFQGKGEAESRGYKPAGNCPGI